MLVSWRRERQRARRRSGPGGPRRLATGVYCGNRGREAARLLRSSSRVRNSRRAEYSFRMNGSVEVPSIAALNDLVGRCSQINRYATQLTAAEESRVAALAAALV